MTEDQLKSIEMILKCYNCSVNDLVRAHANRERPSKLDCLLNDKGVAYMGPSDDMDALAREIIEKNDWLSSLDLGTISFSYIKFSSSMPKVFYVKHRLQFHALPTSYTIYSTSILFPNKEREQEYRTMFEQCLVQIKLDTLDNPA